MKNTMKYIDLDYLKEVSRGNHAFVVKTINSFIEQVTNTLPEMEHQIANKDWEDLSSLMHRMKPCLDIMGIHSLKETVAYIEESTSNNVDLENIPGLVEEVKSVFKDVIAELEVEKKILMNYKYFSNNN